MADDGAMHAPAPERQFELDTISSRWQLALDADERALNAATHELPASELSRRRTLLAQERAETARALGRLARVEMVHPAPWLSPVPVSNDMIGLPATVTACLFDLDGVLTDSGVLHAWAWGEVLDQFLLRVSEQAGWHFIPFDRETDYREYLDGRPGLEGVHAFLRSRGIRLREGWPDDPAEADSAYGLARRKAELLTHHLHRRGSTALSGARRYLEAAGHAGLRRAVISASIHTAWMLHLAGLDTLVEARVDADVIRTQGLRSRPAPDLLESACRTLDVDPFEAVTFTHSGAGAAAGRAAGLSVVGIGENDDADLLASFGAERVFPSLRALIDRRLAEGA